MPSTPLTSSSIGFTNNLSESSADIPVWLSETYIIGILTSGVDYLGMVIYVAAPETIMNIKSKIS